MPKVEMPAQVQSRPALAPSPSQVALQRRPHTEEPDEFVEITNEALLAMSDEQLHSVLVHLGITIPMAWSRDKMLELIMKVAQSARDV